MKKIVIYNTHFAWIEKDMLDKLDIYLEEQSKQCKNEINRSIWVKQECEKHLNISISSKEDIQKLDEKLKELYYLNKAEWLRERIRRRINVNS